MSPSPPEPDAVVSARRPARLPGQERREHFLQVAAELVAAEGVDAVTMEGVAAAAGVSKGLCYAYFANRGELLLAVLEQEVAVLNRRIVAALNEATGFEDKLRGAVHAWFETVIERGGVLGTLLTASQIQRPLKQRRNAMYRRLEDFYGDLAVAEFGVPRDRAVAAASILMAGLQGILDRWYLAHDPREMLEDTFVRVSVAGMRALADEPLPVRR